MYKIMLTIVSIVFILSFSASIHAQSKPKPDMSYLLIVPKYDKEVEEQARKDYPLTFYDKLYYYCVKNKYVMITANKSYYHKIEWSFITTELKEILLRKP